MTLNNTIPCVVDLDGTLISTDSLHESLLKLIFRHPFIVLKFPFWLLSGKASFKAKVSSLIEINAATLPYNSELIKWLAVQKSDGRSIVLCTAADIKIADAISNHLKIFDVIMASDGDTNLAGVNKGEALKNRFGEKGFDYAGDSNADLEVWKYARRAILVGSRPALFRKVTDICEIDVVMPNKNSSFLSTIKALRLHQWVKNVLLFVPILAAHEISDVVLLFDVVLGFVAFSLTASAVYLVNDLADLDNDRGHPRKCRRPFAAGDIPLYHGVALSPLLLSVSFLIASYVNNGFLLWLLAYLCITTLYTFVLKKLVLVDCLTLAFLYTLRIVAGAAAIEQELSFWLVAFAVFLFLSLAFIKRNAEINSAEVMQNGKISGRGYIEGDGLLVLVMGVAACYSSVMVFALYLNSEAITLLYKWPELMWAQVPIILFWMSWMWLQSHRAKMHDDPLVFAIKDKVSLICGLMFGLVGVIASVGLPL
jgi:4-hydroxybenzoate polyprenyltransferase/phosphoserine phosphatase